MDRYAVVGHPIAHSKSPMIHEMFAKQTNQNLVYEKIEAPVNGFESCVTDFFSASNGKGLNVTVPFKERAWDLCADRTERAELAGAVNTLYLDQNRNICGDNTDGVGLVSDLKKHGVDLHGKKILILGAGGAVRGVLQPILKEQPEKVFICNRTESKAAVLVDVFGHLGKLESGPFSAFDNGNAGSENTNKECTGFDLIINGTSASLSGDLPPISNSVITARTVSYDMMYAEHETVFNRWASEAGASKTIDGLGMLVGQAAEAFSIWRGCSPETNEVMKKLRVL